MLLLHIFARQTRSTSFQYLADFRSPYVHTQLFKSGLSVRYAGLQPVAFIPNDANALFYSGSDKRAEWFTLNKLHEATLKGGPGAFATFRKLLGKSGASYVLLQDGFADPKLDAQIRKMMVVVERKGEWTLLHLPPLTTQGAPDVN